jgi:hypothetical protein
MTGIVRYVAADAARSQRWVAPLLFFAAAVVIFNTDAGPLLTTYADTAACLLPVAAWLTVVVVNAEDPIQTDVSIVTVGNDIQFRLGKLVTAFLACAGLTAASVVAPLVAHDYPGSVTAGDVAAGVAGHLLVAVLGVAVGSLGARPVIRRSGWAFLVLSAACLADIVIPHAPPTRQLLVLFDEDAPHGLARSLTANGAETLVLATAVIAVALSITRRRS